jgi:mannitol-1-/sugar-/sorbitol-6-phosphatase
LITLHCDAILFDMDGTLVDSTGCVKFIWGRWAQKHGIDLDFILQNSHGRRTIDTLNQIAPHLDVAAEAEALEKEEIAVREGMVAVGGAVQLLKKLKPHQWAVVTSAGRTLATARLEYAGIPAPPVLICADDVRQGKPDPEGYLKAAERLGVSPSRCVVVEDAPAGILAGRNAGMTVLALTTTFSAEELSGNLCVPDFHGVEFSFS